MRRGHWATIVAGLAIAATATVTAGCGSGTTNALSLDPVAAAATKTQQAGGARVRFALGFESPQLQGGKTTHVRGSGVIDGTSGELTFDPGSRGSMKERFLRQDGDYVLYLQLGALAANLPTGKQWVELDLSKLGKSAGVDLGTLLAGSQLQPSDLLAMLESEGAKVQDLGSATVDGTATTRYRVKVDLAKALEDKGLTSPQLGALAAEMPTIPVDVWIGKDGLVRRIQSSFGAAHGGRSGHLAVTMDVFDYGTHVTIAAPPAVDVFDATQLAQQGFGGTSG